MDLAWRGSYIHRWGTRSDIHSRRMVNDSRTTHKRIWCWATFVCDFNCSYSCKLKYATKDYRSHIPEWDIPSKPCMTRHSLPFTPHTHSLQRGALACAEFTGNVVGYSFSVVSSASFSVNKSTITQMSPSGPTTFALSSTQICHGVSPFSSNVSSASYLLEELSSFPKAHGTSICFGPSVHASLHLWLVGL